MSTNDGGLVCCCMAWRILTLSLMTRLKCLVQNSLFKVLWEPLSVKILARIVTALLFQLDNRCDSKYLSRALERVKSFPCISSFNSHINPMKLVWFFLPPFQRWEKRQQGTKCLSWCHTANESVYGSHASAAVLQCVGMKNDLVMFNRKIYIPFIRPLGLFFNGFLGNDFYLGGWGGKNRGI